MALDGHVLLTGATGFVGQAVLEKLLSAYPDTTISVLVRPKGSLTGTDRIARLLKKQVFRTWRQAVGDDGVTDALQNRINVLEGDLDNPPEIPADLSVVIHSASTVSFDMPIDEAFASNVAGPISLYDALLATGSNPHVVHVSTSYVAGLRRGVAEERSLDLDLDPEVELARALATPASADAASRRPELLKRLLAKAEAEHRRAGAGAVSEAAEDARKAWVRDQLVEAGRLRAQSLGWPDVYTFTKALGEQIADDKWAGNGHRLSIVRPAIIESALKHPYPGWIDGFKVADPLIAAYGRGLLPEFPGLADTIIDIVPVDFVVNAILAAAATPPQDGTAQYFQVSSGSANPLRFGQLYRLVRDYFTAHPLTDAKGTRVTVPSWSFPRKGTVERALSRRERAVDVADKAIGMLPPILWREMGQRTRGWISTLYRARRDLGTLRKFASLYQPYTQTEVIFDNERTRALHESLPKDRRDEHGFDMAEIDWPEYLLKIHIPGVPGLMRGDSEGRKGAVETELPRRRDVLAIFDLQRTVAVSSLIEHYLWTELAAQPARRWPGVLGSLITHSPKYLQAEHRDRSDFIRTFMRRYAGVHEGELRALIAQKVTPSLHRGLLKEAVERIQAHRAAGHRTVLVTGEVDVFVEPLAPLFDDVVAGRMETDELGHWTGHLANSPLVGEARANWLRRYARDEGMDLSASYAYADSYADRPWLDVVGNPNAVNPDADLYRYAKARRWPIHTWTTTAETRLAPVLRSMSGPHRPVRTRSDR